MITPTQAYGEKRKERLTKLELLHEKWVNALEHLCVYHFRIHKAYGKKIKAKEFKVGDLVLKEDLTNTKSLKNEKKDKFKPN